jgi:plastocyanin
MLLSPALGAAELAVSVGTSKAAVADAVISVVPHGGALAPHEGAPATRIIDQKNEAFIPYVETFRPGDSVVFRNSDQTRHHVYSFAPARQFEFVLTPGQSSAPLRLEHAGAIAVGCNIHDHMITYLYVADAPWVERTGVDGKALLSGLPPGDYDVSVWHPQLRPGQTPPQQALHIGASGDHAQLSFTLTLLADPRRGADRERVDY